MIQLAMINAQSGMFILFILLLLFGAKKLPELARGLGQAIKEFSKAKNDIHDEIMREPVPEPPRQIPPQTVQQAPGTQPVNAEPQPNPHV
jgi:sec-independent protein translocase protein TatA